MATPVGLFRGRGGGGGTLLVLDRAKIEGFGYPGGMTYSFINELGREIVRGAKASLFVGHGYDTGAMQRSIDHSVTPAGAGQVFMNVRATADHSLFYHEGTRPHRISAVNGEFLKFPVPPRSGNVVKARTVRHPGFGGHPFLREAMETVLAKHGMLS